MIHPVHPASSIDVSISALLHRFVSAQNKFITTASAVSELLVSTGSIYGVCAQRIRHIYYRAQRLHAITACLQPGSLGSQAQVNEFTSKQRKNQEKPMSIAKVLNPSTPSDKLQNRLHLHVLSFAACYAWPCQEQPQHTYHIMAITSTDSCAKPNCILTAA